MVLGEEAIPQSTLGPSRLRLGANSSTSQPPVPTSPQGKARNGIILGSGVRDQRPSAPYRCHLAVLGRGCARTALDDVDAGWRGPAQPRLTPTFLPPRPDTHSSCRVPSARCPWVTRAARRRASPKVGALAAGRREPGWLPGMGEATAPRHPVSETSCSDAPRHRPPRKHATTATG